MCLRAGIVAIAWLVLGHGSLQAAPAALVGEWSFDQGEGLSDGSGQGRDATFFSVTRVPGQAGQAVHLDGVKSHVDLPESPAYAFTGHNTFTVELWIRTTRQDFCTPLMARHGGDVSFSFVLGRRPGHIAWELWSWGSVKLISRTMVADGAWHHVVGTHDAATGNAALVVDGRLEAVARAGSGGPGSVMVRLGNNIGCDQYFSGDIDDLRIWRGRPAEIERAMERYEHWVLLDPDRVRHMQQAWLDRADAPHEPAAKSVAEWEARREVIRERVMACLGLSPEPERLPLKVHVSGELDRDGYVVKRVYWQTWPNYYAAGYLYVPKGLTGRVPAVLNPHGHFENGNRNPVVQARLISLARKGYVCLTVDSVHAADYYAGVSPLTVMTWNNLRGIDLLCSLPEVDPTRIGCTGASGGAQQTFYLTAVEDRIAAAVTVCMVSEFRRILAIDVAHCYCNHVPGIAAETDATEMSACLAPKPSLFICVTQDWTRWFPHEGYPQIKAIYDLYQAGDKTNCIQHDWGHDYSKAMREEMYAWFNKWLKGIDDPEQAKEAPLTAESLETLATLDGTPPGAGGVEAVFAESRARLAAPAFGTESKASVGQSAERVRRDLAKVFREPEGEAVPRAEVLGHETVDGVTVVRALVETEAEVSVPVLLLLPEGRGERRLPAAIVTNTEGEAILAAGSWADLTDLAGKGMAVALVDVRDVGQGALNADTQRLNGIILGRPEAAVGAHDLVAVGRWLRSRPEVDPARVGVVGLGGAGTLALLAAALDPALACAVCPDIGPTYEAGRTEPTASHMVTVGDLPEIAAACAPRPLWLGGAGAGKGWDVTREAYARTSGPPVHLAADAGDLSTPGLKQWLCDALGAQPPR